MYRIETNTINREATKNGIPVTITRYQAIGWIATPKGKYAKEKFAFNYVFATEAERDAYVAKVVANENERMARKEAKKAAKKNLVNPYKMGEILYASWGYDQTNINFYEVVEVGKKSVKIREVRQRITKDQWVANMSEYVAAIPGDFISAPMTKVVQVYLDSNGKPVYYLNGRYGHSLSKWDGTPKYQSHYA